MSVKLKIRTSPPPSPCKHVVVTATEDGVDRVQVFHDSDFEDDDYQPDVDWKEMFKVFEKRLILTGNLFSESQSDFNNKFYKNKIEDEDEQ